MSRYSEQIAQFSPGRKSSYDVEAELIVRKKLEKRTGYCLEFTRTDNVYATDISCIRYSLGVAWSKDVVGYVEVEESAQWVNGIYPENWRTYSYLKRKVFAFDRDAGIFTERLVDNAQCTFYLKVARDLSDCHCSLVKDIGDLYDKEWIDPRGGLGADEYNRTMLRFNIDSPHVSRGWDDTIEKIKRLFSTQ